MSRPEWDKLGRFTAKLAEHARKFSDLSILQVLSPIPLPPGHPDLDDFDADIAEMTKLARLSNRSAQTVTSRDWGADAIIRHIEDSTVFTTIHRRMVQEHNDKGRTSPETALLQDFITFRDLGIRIRQWT